MEAPLKKDIKIDLKKGVRKNCEYSRWRIEIDDASNYGIKSVYCATNSMFGECLKINKYENNN